MTRNQHRMNEWEVYPIVEIQGVKVRIPPPSTIECLPIVERQEILESALAAWMRVDGLRPMNFRLYGPPGVGKNMIVYQLAKMLNKDLYMVTGHTELGPEEIACSARIASNGEIEYVASPLFAAMLHGGIFFFDEIAKASPAALDPLASVLDDRRILRSGLACISLKAHEEFLFCAALNEDEETGGRLPQFIAERLSPAIAVDIPPAPVLKRILRSTFPQAEETWIETYLTECWQDNISPREAVTHLQFARALAGRGGISAVTPQAIREALQKARACTNGTGVDDATMGRSKRTNDTTHSKEVMNGNTPIVVSQKGRRTNRTH